jgi:hypothetical protein
MCASFCFAALKKLLASEAWQMALQDAGVLMKSMKALEKSSII